MANEVNVSISDCDWFDESVKVDGQECKKKFGLLTRSFNKKRSMSLTGDKDVLINWKHTPIMNKIFELEPTPRADLTNIVDELASLNRKVDFLTTVTMGMERKFRDMQVELVPIPAENENLEENDQVDANPDDFNPEEFIDHMMAQE